MAESGVTEHRGAKRRNGRGGGADAAGSAPLRHSLMSPVTLWWALSPLRGESGWAKPYRGVRPRAPASRRCHNFVTGPAPDRADLPGRESGSWGVGRGEIVARARLRLGGVPVFSVPS